ncbi:MAG: RagB/SusD family nutrient uptake outer membrane protein [Paludibacter sp.]|nr:RagB/SusD family nutrient uptake outer membrane protein [Paludibacter sp.]
MKNIYIIILVISTIFTSCSDDFLLTQNPNKIDSENYYQTESQINAAVNGTYGVLRQYPELYFFYLSEGRSNNYYSGTSNAQRDLVDISNYNETSELTSLEEAWELGYSLIAKTNKVLSVIDDVSFKSEGTKTIDKAQMRFLRAFGHFELLRVFGNIPIIENVISPVQAGKIGRSDRIKVLEFIESDLKYAIDNLPESYTSTELGKVTKQAAMAYLAKVYLTWGQYPIYNANKIDNAISLLTEITGKASYMTWATKFEDIFKSASDNKYCMFEIQFFSGSSGLGATFPSELLPSQMKEFPYTGGVPRLSPSEDILKQFDKKIDLRFDATFDTIYTNSYYVKIKENITAKWFETGFKLLNRNDWPQNFPLIRPAEVNLMYAEALLVKNDLPTTEAINSLNKTRLRAGLEYYTPATKEEFEQELQNEYRREFVAEGVYWHYLVRSGKAVDVMNSWFTNTSQNITIDEKRLIYPVPYLQMSIYPGLYTQNPGY